jgi:cobalamin biosynthesis protein CobD/CbiB
VLAMPFIYLVVALIAVGIVGWLINAYITVPTNIKTILNIVLASVITSKPAICDHFKTGQRSWAQDMKLFYRVGTSSGKFFSISL